MRDQTDVFPRIRQNITAPHGTLIRPPMHMPRNVCLQPISPVIIYRRKRTKIVRAQSIQPPHVCVAGAVDHAIRLSFVQMHRNDPFAQSIPVTAFPRCAAVRIQPVKEKHEYVAAPTRRHTVQSAKPRYFVRQSAPPQTGDVICLRADEPAARFRKYSALTTKKRDIPSRFLIVLNRCGNYTNSMIAVSEASPRRSPRGMMRV